MPKFNLGWLTDKNGDKFAPKTFIKQVISETGKSLQDILNRKISSPIVAEVGQQLIVKEVDENGVPTDWECVDVQDKIQADYNQSDSSSPDYIKNKPTNLVTTTDLDDYVKTTRYATSDNVGLVQTNTLYGTAMNGQYITTSPATTSEISAKGEQYKPIVPKYVDYAVKAGLGNSALAWTDAEKAKARDTIGVKQNNWEQYDDTASDYIQNRTHYYKSINVNIEQEVNHVGLIYSSNYSEIDKKWHELLVEKITEGTKIDGHDIVYSGETGYVLQYKLIGNDNCTLFVVKTEPKASIVDYDDINAYAKPKICSCNYSKSEIKLLDEKYIPSTIPRVSTASIGQILEIEETDENGKPIKWKATDKPTGGEGENTPFIDEDGYIVYGVENPSSTVYSKLEIDAMFESFLNGSEVAW